MWIEGRNAPCDGASFRNVTVVDALPRAAVAFMADVQDMTGEISVHNPHCKPQTAPQGKGNSLLISCDEEGV